MIRETIKRHWEENLPHHPGEFTLDMESFRVEITPHVDIVTKKTEYWVRWRQKYLDGNRMRICCNSTNVNRYGETVSSLREAKACGEVFANFMKGKVSTINFNGAW